MKQAGQAPRASWNPNRAAPHPHSIYVIKTKEILITGSDTPAREIGRGCDHTHVMTARSQPGRKFTGVFTNANRLRRVIKTVNKNFQNDSASILLLQFVHFKDYHSLVNGLEQCISKARASIQETPLK